MKIINKLTLGYLIVSLLFMIVAIVGVVTINNINVAFDRVSEETIPVVESLENVKMLGLQMGLSASEFVLIRAEGETNNVSLEETEKEQIKSAMKKYDDAISRYEELVNKFSPDEKDTVEAIKKSGNKFHNASNQIIALKEQGASGKIVIDKWEEFEGAEEEFLKEIDNAIAHERDEFASREQNVEAMIAISVKIIQIAALFIFSIAIALGVIISKSISDPITRLKNAVEAIEKGKMDTRVDIRSSDDLGILGAGFNKMAATLEQNIIEHEKADDEQRQSYEIQSVLNSLLRLTLEEKTLDDILKGVLDSILSIPWLAVESKGSIFLVEDEPDVLVMKAQTGLSKIIQEKCSRVPFGRCICGRAAKMHEIQFADHLDDRHDVIYDGMQPHGHYCIPIISAGTMLGVIDLYLKEGHQRRQQEETFLNAVADTLAGIIQRKRSESALKESEECHRLLVNLSPYGIAIHSNGKIMYMNLAGARILGSASPEQFIGKNVIEIIHPEYHDIVRERIRLQKTGKAAPSIEEVFVRSDGTFVDVEITSIPLTYESKPAMYGVFRDITERKRHEETRLENIRLEEADKAKSEFLASMSHELRTPLSASIGFSELLKQKTAGELNEKQERYVDNIIASSQFLLTLINDILDLSKIEAGKIELVKENISLPVTLKETLSLIKEKAMKNNVLLNTEIDPELEFIIADKQRFKQIMFNLLSNAVKFSREEGGTVTITTKKEGNMAQISVSDTGIGIREENISRLFHKFEQLEPGITSKYGGTGLGLAITKQLIEMHGGNIRVESRYGEGSTFSFSIPVERKLFIEPQT